ncbi:MAG: FAD-dependent protein, partial [Chitinophagaceae bacterium]
ISASLPHCSYLPGLQSVSLMEVPPSFIHTRLQIAFKEFGKKMRGYFTNEAVVVATESRTSSPVRIPRDANTLQHPQIKNLYPCAEGAGYAGGIVSAAMDGERVASQIAAVLTNN